LVAEDVRFVDVAGVVLTGRGKFEALQSRTHAMRLKERVRFVTDTDTKFLALWIVRTWDPADDDRIESLGQRLCPPSACDSE
jgi:hypothetical protein